MIAGLGAWASTRLIEERRARSVAERHHAAQLAATRVLAESATLGEAIPLLFAAICEGEGWDWGGMWEVDDDAQLLRCQHVWRSPSLPVPEFERMTRMTTFPRRRASGPGLGYRPACLDSRRRQG